MYINACFWHKFACNLVPIRRVSVLMHSKCLCYCNSICVCRASKISFERHGLSHVWPSLVKVDLFVLHVKQLSWCTGAVHPNSWFRFIRVTSKHLISSFVVCVKYWLNVCVFYWLDVCVFYWLDVCVFCVCRSQSSSGMFVYLSKFDAYTLSLWREEASDSDSDSDSVYLSPDSDSDADSV
jgi:hypothetical protein